MPKRDQVVARRATVLAQEESAAEIARLRAEVEKLCRVRDAAEIIDQLAYLVSDATLQEALLEMRAALDAAKEPDEPGGQLRG